MNANKSPRHRSSQAPSKGRSEGRSSAGGSGNNSNKYIRECTCGRGLACIGMTQAFRLLGDPRCYYVELPRYRKDPPAYKYTFRNNLRAAYLRHLKMFNPDLDLAALEESTERRYVALHHFHPAVVKAFYGNPLTSGTAQRHKVPISITEHELQELNMKIYPEDRILSVSGFPTGGYYFCPSYPQEQAHEDLKNLIKTERANRESREKKKQEAVVPENIEISTKKPLSVRTDPSLSPTKKQQQQPSPELSLVKDTSNPQDAEKPSSVPPHDDGQRAEFVNDGGTDQASSGDAPAEMADTSEPTVSKTSNTPTKEPIPIAAIVAPEVSSEMDAAMTQKEEREPEMGSAEAIASKGPSNDTDDSGGDMDEQLESLDAQKTALPAVDSYGGTSAITTFEDNDKNDESSTEDAAIADTNEKEDVKEGDEFNVNVDNGGAPDFDSLWAEEENDNFDTVRAKTLGINESIVEEEEYRKEDDEPAAEANGKSSHPEEGKETESISSSASPTRRANRDSAHPWDSPSYRRRLERPRIVTRIQSAPAQFIDPSPSKEEKLEDEVANVEIPEENTQLEPTELRTVSEDSEVKSTEENGVPIVKPGESVSTVQKSAAALSAAALKAMDAIDETKVPSTIVSDVPIQTSRSNDADGSSRDPPGWNAESSEKTAEAPSSNANRIIGESKSWDEKRSSSIVRSSGTGVVTLTHHMPGTDPTLRIQVHNDLIAWESRRRSDIANLLELNKQKWHAARDILREGSEEVGFAERLVLGFAKAGSMFADSIDAVNDDKLLDDSGNTVSNSFLQNRLYKRRAGQEYSIDNQDSSTESGQSALLNAILEAQVAIATNFRESTQHIEEELIPDLQEVQVELLSSARQLESLGDAIITELTRSEIEVKSIWDVFDAMVTGDLMEYSVHGSMHGSQHGGSIHSGSLHGFMGQRGDNDGHIVSSVHSPMVKSTFRQLGAIEDGWLVEMYYRSAVTYQSAVFSAAENELRNLSKAIVDLEARRFQKLREVMLAFVPRQRRLFKGLPEHLKQVLNDLVGLRIDEESLQNLIDESIRDRSHDHLKRGEAHRSAIMNRSRVSKAKDAAEVEVEEIESAFGKPFKSSMVLLSKVVELQPGGLRGIVNTTWKAALVVVTAEGGLHVFTLPDGTDGATLSPAEAFEALYPSMNFASPSNWNRKVEIVKSLTPTLTLNLKHSSVSIPKMQNRHLLIAEEKPGGGGGGRNTFMKAMKAAADSQRGKRCTIRLPSAADVTEWMNLLERTKKVLSSKGDAEKGTRFRI